MSIHQAVHEATNDDCPGSDYGHTWVAGIMRVHDEDVESVAAVRPVECERCEYVYQVGS